MRKTLILTLMLALAAGGALAGPAAEEPTVPSVSTAEIATPQPAADLVTAPVTFMAVLDPVCKTHCITGYKYCEILCQGGCGCDEELQRCLEYC